MAVMELVFRPGVTTQVEIDDNNLLFCATGGALPAGTVLPDQTQIVQRALENPIGAERLEDLLLLAERCLVDAELGLHQRNAVPRREVHLEGRLLLYSPRDYHGRVPYGRRAGKFHRVLLLESVE